ncbi:MAG: 16S rRNA (uracil(1498)-N(3))-methyltransferase [Clostridiales bacterium]|nr:16S rRNA (uracil(1498)-N(3))-methyltransferase [Clostridiales bacterium]
MEIKRFFANSEDYDGSNIRIYGEEFTHMTKVLRHKVGYKIIVNLDDGKDYNCTLSEIKSDCAIARIDSVTDNECKAKASVTLFQALPKGDKFDFIVQKCVELGVEKITPFLSKYTNESKFNYARSQRIALEACKQCGRSRKAEIGELTDFDGLIDELKDYDVIIMPYENSKVGKIGQIKGLESGKKIALIIGSEGGFCEEEVQRVKNLGGEIVSLGKRILRCETASIVAVSLVMYELGELQG